jgi:hypothetical protein
MAMRPPSALLNAYTAKVSSVHFLVSAENIKMFITSLCLPILRLIAAYIFTVYFKEYVFLIISIFISYF